MGFKVVEYDKVQEKAPVRYRVKGSDGAIVLMLDMETARMCGITPGGVDGDAWGESRFVATTVEVGDGADTGVLRLRFNRWSGVKTKRPLLRFARSGRAKVAGAGLVWVEGNLGVLNGLSEWLSPTRSEPVKAWHVDMDGTIYVTFKLNKAGVRGEESPAAVTNTPRAGDPVNARERPFRTSVARDAGRPAMEDESKPIVKVPVVSESGKQHAAAIAKAKELIPAPSFSSKPSKREIMGRIAKL